MPNSDWLIMKNGIHNKTEEVQQLHHSNLWFTPTRTRITQSTCEPPTRTHYICQRRASSVALIGVKDRFQTTAMIGKALRLRVYCLCYVYLARENE